MAIFCLIVLQELGVPVPAPNEFLLMFFGYLVFQGPLALPLVIIVTILASITGAWILYGAFYIFGTWIHPRLPTTLQEVVKKASEKINQHPLWIFVGRIAPFGRGYICIAAGLSKIKPLQFLAITFITDTLWNAGFVFLGFCTGQYWEVVAVKVGGIVHLILYIIITFIAYQLGKFLISKK
jgi:membrane protein DedA with SNARE-associated domain